MDFSFYYLIILLRGYNLSCVGVGIWSKQFTNKDYGSNSNILCILYIQGSAKALLLHSLVVLLLILFYSMLAAMYTCFLAKWNVMEKQLTIIK